MSIQRLDKAVASVGGLTRSEARDLIKRGQVAVNGITVKDCALKLQTESDILTVDGKSREYEEFVYYLLNKPSGMLSASRDKKAPTVLDLIKPADRRKGLFCVGRLDKDTTGLLIITDDGEFGHRVISPKSKIKKTYLATLDGSVTGEMTEKFKNGITLADGTVCLPAELVAFGGNTAEVTICEGKYHQIKRMFGTVGLGVCALKRLSIGKMSLPDGLAEGEYVKLCKKDLDSILAGSDYI